MAYQRQAPGTLYPSLSPPPHAPLFTPLFPRPLRHGVLWRVQVASCPALLSKPGRKTKTRCVEDKKHPENEDILLSTSCLEPAVLPVPTGLVLVCCCCCCCCLLSMLRPSSGWPLQFEQNGWEVNPLQPLGTSLALVILTGPWYVSYAHTHTHTHTHTHAHTHTRWRCRVFLSELPATSSACCLERTGNNHGIYQRLTHTYTQTHAGFNTHVHSPVVWGCRKVNNQLSIDFL